MPEQLSNVWSSISFCVNASSFASDCPPTITSASLLVPLAARLSFKAFDTKPIGRALLIHLLRSSYVPPANEAPSVLGGTNGHG